MEAREEETAQAEEKATEGQQGNLRKDSDVRMSQKQDKKMRKSLRFTAKESVQAFRDMIKRLRFRRRVQLAWKILWNRV